MQTSYSSKQFRSRSFSQRKRTQQEATPNSTVRSGFRPACSMAEFNRVKQFKKTGQTERYELGQPIRIVIPAFFNVPQHENLAVQRPRAKSPRRLEQMQNKSYEPEAYHNQHEMYLTGITPVQPQQQSQPVRPSATVRKIRDLKMISLAMRRQKNLKEESRTYYCSAVLYDNLGDYRQAVEQYERFLRIALFLQDRCSIELVLNSIGVAYMKLEQFSRAVDYHQKQHELAEQPRNKFTGSINAGLCREKMGELKEAFAMYTRAYQEGQGSIRRQNLAKEYVREILIKSAGDDELQRQASEFLEHECNTEHLGDSMIKSYVKRAEMDATRHNYAGSRLKFAKALQFGYLNDQTKRITQAKQYMKQAKLGYAISTAQNKMDIFLKTYSDNINKYKL